MKLKLKYVFVLPTLFFANVGQSETFTLARQSFYLFPNQPVDTLQPDWDVEGILIVDGNRVTKHYWIKPAGGRVIEEGYTGVIIDVNYGIVRVLDDTNYINNIVIVSCCNPLITYHEGIFGSRVEQWVPVNSPQQK